MMRTFDAEKERLKSVKVAVEGSSPLETPVPNRSLLQIYPKWQRVARRWFEGTVWALQPRGRLMPNCWGAEKDPWPFRQVKRGGKPGDMLLRW